MCSGTGNDQHSLMEYKLAGFVHILTVLVIDPACIPSCFNVGGLLRPRRIEELPLKGATECGLTHDFGHYFGIGGSLLAQQLYITARLCIRSIVVEVGNGMTGGAAIFLSLPTLCTALIRHGNWDRLGEVVLHFGSALAAKCS